MAGQVRVRVGDRSDKFVVGDIEITREGIVVSEDEARELLAVGRTNGVRLVGERVEEVKDDA